MFDSEKSLVRWPIVVLFVRYNDTNRDRFGRSLTC